MEENIKDIIKENEEFIDNLKKNESCANVINYPEEKSIIPEYENDGSIEPVVATVQVNPESGEHIVLETASADQIKDLDIDELAQTVAESIPDDEEIEEDTTPLNEEDVTNFVGGEDDSSTLGNMMGDTISMDATRELLEVVNRKIRGETFNVYKEFPEEIRKMIDKYVAENGELLNVNVAQVNSIKKNVAETLLNEFIADIKLSKTKNDFAKDMESIYQSSAKEISDAAMEYIEDRNKAYREAAEKMEDPEKKAKLLAILDQIDEARSLNKFKEFSKTCKLKLIELEKPDSRAFSGFLAKYRNSSNNIYDIKLACKVVTRVLGAEGVRPVYVLAFFVAFCKHVAKLDSSVPTEHAYMYYILYYCALLDSDKSDSFKNAIKEVINNLIERNKNLLGEE